MSLKHWRCGEYVNQSERRAAEYLTARLQGAAPNVDWVLLTNYANSSGSQHLADDIDIVVVSSLGVSAVEIKHWGAADLKGDRLFTAEHEANKINEKAKRLKGKISKGCSFDVGYVEGKFLFTKNESEKFASGNNTRRRVNGVEVFGLPEWKDLFETYRQPVLTKEQVAAICKVLHPIAAEVALGRPTTFENFFDMKLVEDMGGGFHRVFQARRKFSRDKVLLHLYDLSASPEKNPLERSLPRFVSQKHLSDQRAGPAPDQAHQMQRRLGDSPARILSGRLVPGVDAVRDNARAVIEHQPTHLEPP